MPELSRRARSDRCVVAEAVQSPTHLGRARDVLLPPAALERLLERGFCLVEALRHRENLSEVPQGEALVVERIGLLAPGHSLTRQPLGLGELAAVRVDACQHLAPEIIV